MSDGSIIIDTSLDQSGIEKGLKSLGNVASKGLSGVTKAITAVSTAIGGIATAAIKVGSDFEAQMSKVKAISKASSEEMELLNEKAKEMGAKTKFSATEAGQAMEYMGMAGWNASQMIDGLSGVMNLAAASGEDLGTTSDIVTDALTALKMQASDAAHFADILASAATNSNTNVSMMGETFKYVAPIAGSLGYNAEDLAVAIGLMANSGIKASQAGTSLRSVLTNMAKPTDTVQVAMTRLGLSLTDEQGNMKSLHQQMIELREGFSKLTEEEKVSTAAALAGKYGMSGLLAIVNASNEDFNKLTNSIANCNGSAEEMAKTMNDNLKGNITILKSSLEGLGIELYESVDNPLKDIAKSATNMVNSLSKALKKDGFEGLVTKAGDILGEIVSNMAKETPKVINVAVSVINTFIKGLQNNSNKLSKAGVKIITSLIKGIKEIIPNVIDLGTSFVSNLVKAITKVDISKELKGFSNKLKTAFKNITKDLISLAQTIIPPLTKVIGFLADNINILLPLITASYTAFKTWTVLSSVTKALDGFNLATKAAALAQGAFNAVMNANPIVLVGTLLASITTAMLAFGVSIDNTNEKTEALKTKIYEASDSYKDLKESQEENINSGLAEIEYTEKLWKELQTLADSNGKVNDSNKDRAQFILGELNEALGTEYTMTGNQIDKYNELSSSIDNLIAKKKAMIVLEAQEPAYKEAILNLEQQQIDTAKAKQGLEQAELDLKKAKIDFDNASTTGEIRNAKTRLKNAQKNVDEYNELYNTSKSTLEQYYSDISTYETNSALIQKGNIEDLEKVYSSYGQVIKDHTKLTKGELEQQMNDYQTAYGEISKAYREGVEGVTLDMVNEARERAVEARKEFEEAGKEGVQGTIDGMNLLKPEFLKTTNDTATSGLKTFEDNFTNKMSIPGSKGISNASNGANNEKGNFTSTMGNIGLEGKNKFDEYFTNTHNVGAKGVSNASSGANSKRQELESTMSNIGYGAHGVFEKNMSSDKGYVVGQNIVNGSINGANSKRASLEEAMANIAQGALASAKASLGIHSPSRLFRDIVGKNIVKGIEVGVDVETPNLEENIKDNLSNVLNNLDISSLVSRMELAVNYEVASTGNTITQKTINNNSNFAKTVTNNNDNGLTIKIDKFENNRRQDIKALSEELEFYRKQLARGVGRE